METIVTEYFICECGDNFPSQSAYQIHQQIEHDALRNSPKVKVEKQTPIEDTGESMFLVCPESTVGTTFDQSTCLFNEILKEEPPYEVEYIVEDTSCTNDVLDDKLAWPEAEYEPVKQEEVSERKVELPDQTLVKSRARLDLEHNYWENERGDGFVCELCNHQFATPRALHLHAARVHASSWREQRRRARNGLRPVICELCGKSYVSKTALRYHQRSHTGERPYPCPICGKGFAMLAHLQLHAIRHTGEKPFRCRMCPKAFPTRAGQQRHERVHTGEKPYACQECVKTFAQSNALKQHVRVMHRKLPSLYKKTRGRKATVVRRPPLLSEYQDDNTLATTSPPRIPDLTS